MNANELFAFVSLVASLSVATERLVEIIKGTFFPRLMKEITALPTATPAEIEEAQKKEVRRKAKIQALSAVCGILTAILAKAAVEPYLPGSSKSLLDSWAPIFAMGLLASGGSGFWNSIVQYLLQVKSIKQVEATEKKEALAAKPAPVAPV